MAKRAKPQPRCIIIAGPNGAGKTTFARNYLLQDAGIENFVNADSIAAGLSPLKSRNVRQERLDACCSRNWTDFQRLASPSLWKVP